MLCDPYSSSTSHFSYRDDRDNNKGPNNNVAVRTTAVTTTAMTLTAATRGCGFG